MRVAGSKGISIGGSFPHSLLNQSAAKGSSQDWPPKLLALNPRCPMSSLLGAKKHTWLAKKILQYHPKIYTGINILYMLPSEHILYHIVSGLGEQGLRDVS